MMNFKYLMFNAPSPHTIDRAAELGCNWVIVHSAGHESQHRPSDGGAAVDALPIYFEDYPRVARIRRDRCGCWLDPLRRDVTALCERAVARDLKVAFHMYEPSLPRLFESEYPQLVSVWHRPTQSGTMYVHTLLDPDNPDTWQLIRSKYAELARAFPLLGMVILTTWDGDGVYWCVPTAKMPIHRRLVRMVEAATEGVRSVREDIAVCFRLWGRNWPRQLYLDGHRLIAEVTGVENASELMEPVCRPHNDPDKVLPKLFTELPADVPVMYKSTRMDIFAADDQPLTLALGAYPKDREQIIEVSYERFHQKPWPWCKIAHIRKGLEGARKHHLAGVLALPIQMGINARVNPESGNLGRMNTWLLARLLEGDPRTDAELVTAWLEVEFGGPQPREVAEVLLEAGRIANEGIQWGRGVPARAPFASLHATKLCWMSDGFVAPEFPYQMANPTRELIENMIAMKHAAHERARAAVRKIQDARARMDSRLFEELSSCYAAFADAVQLCQGWHSYLLMQYGIERNLYLADRLNLGRMSRYAEHFIRNLVRFKEATSPPRITEGPTEDDMAVDQGVDARLRAFAEPSFPDSFPLT